LPGQQNRARLCRIRQNLEHQRPAQHPLTVSRWQVRAWLLQLQAWQSLVQRRPLLPAPTPRLPRSQQG
jgi:hypothetical protein